MYKFKIEESFKKGWELTKKHWATLVAAFLITIAISFAIGLVSTLFMAAFQSAPEIGTGIYVFLQLISTLISLWTGYNLYKMMINMIDGVEVKALDVLYYSKDTANKLLKYIGGSLLLALVIIVGLICFIIPGIYFSIRFMFVPMLIIDKNMGIMDSFKKSSEMTKGEIWHLIGFAFISFGIIIVGLIALLVGVIPAAILVSLTNVVVYRKLESHVHNLAAHTHTK